MTSLNKRDRALVALKKFYWRPRDEEYTDAECGMCGAKPEVEFDEYLVYLAPDGKGGWVETNGPVCPVCYALMLCNEVYTGIGIIGNKAGSRHELPYYEEYKKRRERDGQRI